MKKLAAQQVQQEKDEGQKRLEEALKKAREEFLLEKTEAIQKAREEERVIAADEAKKVAQAEEDKRKQLILAAEKEKQVQLVKLITLKNMISIVLGNIATPPGLDATCSPLQVLPTISSGFPNSLPVPINFILLDGERGTVRVECLIQECNTNDPARA